MKIAEVCILCSLFIAKNRQCMMDALNIFISGMPRRGSQGADHQDSDLESQVMQGGLEKDDHLFHGIV